MSGSGPVIPPLTVRQARQVLVGSCLFAVGVGVTALLMLAGQRPFTALVALAGAVVAVLGGGLRFVPSRPRELAATARVARWPAVFVASVAVLCQAFSIAGVLAFFAQGLLAR